VSDDKIAFEALRAANYHLRVLFDALCNGNPVYKRVASLLHLEKETNKLFRIQSLFTTYRLNYVCLKDICYLFSNHHGRGPEDRAVLRTSITAASQRCFWFSPWGTEYPNRSRGVCDRAFFSLFYVFKRLTNVYSGEDTSQLSASPSSLYNNVNGESLSVPAFLLRNNITLTTLILTFLKCSFSYGNVEEQSSLSRGRLRDLLIKQPDPVPLVPPRPHEQNEKKE
jgi:hypothetical protein